MPIASVSEHLRELAIAEYAERHTDKEPALLTRLTREAVERLMYDNTLWGGKVALSDCHDPQTESLRSFNDLIAEDASVEKVLLPLRDGLTLIYKK